jgi:hypothetical protein
MLGDLYAKFGVSDEAGLERLGRAWQDWNRKKEQWVQRQLVDFRKNPEDLGIRNIKEHGQAQHSAWEAWKRDGMFTNQQYTYNWDSGKRTYKRNGSVEDIPQWEMAKHQEVMQWQNSDAGKAAINAAGGNAYLAWERQGAVQNDIKNKHLQWNPQAGAYMNHDGQQWRPDQGTWDQNYVPMDAAAKSSMSQGDIQRATDGVTGYNQAMGGVGPTPQGTAPGMGGGGGGNLGGGGMSPTMQSAMANLIGAGTGIQQELGRQARMDTLMQQFNYQKAEREYQESMGMTDYLKDFYGGILGVEFAGADPSQMTNLSDYLQQGMQQYDTSQQQYTPGQFQPQDGELSYDEALAAWHAGTGKDPGTRAGYEYELDPNNPDRTIKAGAPPGPDTKVPNPEEENFEKWKIKHPNGTRAQYDALVAAEAGGGTGGGPKGGGGGDTPPAMRGMMGGRPEAGQTPYIDVEQYQPGYGGGREPGQMAPLGPGGIPVGDVPSPGLPGPEIDDMAPGGPPIGDAPSPSIPGPEIDDVGGPPPGGGRLPPLGPDGQPFYGGGGGPVGEIPGGGSIDDPPGGGGGGGAQLMAPPTPTSGGYKQLQTAFNPNNPNTWALMAPMAAQIAGDLDAQKKQIRQALGPGGERDRAMAESINRAYGQIGSGRQAMVQDALGNISNLMQQQRFGVPTGPYTGGGGQLAGMQASMYGADKSAMASMYGADKGLQAALTGLKMQDSWNQQAMQQQGQNSMWGAIGSMAGPILGAGLAAI